MMNDYVASYNATCHGMLLRNLILGLIIVNSISRLLKFFSDSFAAVIFSYSNSSSEAELYFSINYLLYENVTIFVYSILALMTC